MLVVASFSRFYGMSPVAVLAMGTVLWLELLERQGVLERGEARLSLRLGMAARWLQPSEDGLQELLDRLDGPAEEVGEAQAAAQAEIDAMLRKGGWR
ncbi:hypothetical protein CVU37_15135 [candidate division BRC1 bacterium HGW-BRC1-1]|nr:MAG: hypothetical protein CVU37_15135 [candidate division BRC1 bacterium HGW-BRC1-1]